ncbi:MAG: VCBS repeat-containing protein [Polyangiaceae bacterium]
MGIERGAWLVSMALVAATGCGDSSASGGGGNNNGGDGSGATGTGGGGVEPPPPSCAAAPGEHSAVATPILRATLSGSWDENWLASPTLIDVDNDGALDIVAARHSVLYAWRGDGTPLWQTAWGYSASSSPEHGDTRMWASAVAGDFDGDGDTEIAVGSDADGSLGMNVAVYDHDGELLAGWPQHFGGSDEVRSIAVADVDGDGVGEILVNHTNAGPVTGVYALDGSMHAGFPQVQPSCDPAPPAEACWDFGGYNQNIAAGDLDGDGVADVVSSYDAIGFGVFKGDGTPFPTAPAFTDRVVTAVEAYHDLALSEQGWGTGDRSEFTYSPPVVADIDGDGDMEIVLAGDHESSESTDNQGITVWVLNHDMTRPAGWDPPNNTGAPLLYGDVGNNIVITSPSPAVGDLDAQPGLEIVVPAYDGKLWAFKSTGEVYWTYTFATTASPYVGASEPLIVDLNGDGAPEIVFTTFTSGSPGMPDTTAYIIVLDGGGNELQRAPLFGRGSMAAPAVGDLDGDGQLELVVSLKDTLGAGQGGVQIWDLPGSQTNCVLWGTGRGGPLRQGWVP